MDILPRLLLEDFNPVVNDSVIEILTTEMRVAVSGQDFKDAVFNSQYRDIKGATTEIKDKDVGLALLVETVGDSGGRRFINNTRNLNW